MKSRFYGYWRISKSEEARIITKVIMRNEIYDVSKAMELSGMDFITRNRVAKRLKRKGLKYDCAPHDPYDRIMEAIEKAEKVAEEIY